jgi:predicted DNA-binding protein (UPF0251 family)/predicted Fe-Mo cluster-binding NifX family protein
MRPRKKRFVRSNPLARFYKPRGIPLRDMEIVTLKDEEWEAINLADYKGLKQEDAARLMGISRPTFSRLISSARKAVASALIEGAALEIGGGDFHILPEETYDQSNPIEEKKMKIAFSTTGNDLSADVEPRFGRALQFLIFDTQTDTFSIINNTTHDAPGGAGVKAAERVAKAGVQVVITGDCGPKAYNVLKPAGIKIYSSKNTSIKEALEQYRAGKLSEIK